MNIISLPIVLKTLERGEIGGIEANKRKDKKIIQLATKKYYESSKDEMKQKGYDRHRQKIAGPSSAT